MDSWCNSCGARRRTLDLCPVCGGTDTGIEGNSIEHRELMDATIRRQSNYIKGLERLYIRLLSLSLSLWGSNPMPELMEVNDDYLVRQYLRTLKDKFARSSRLSRLSQEIDQLRGLIDDNEQYLMAIEAEFKRRYGNNWTSGPTYQDALVKTME